MAHVVSISSLEMDQMEVMEEDNGSFRMDQMEIMEEDNVQLNTEQIRMENLIQCLIKG